MALVVLVDAYCTCADIDARAAAWEHLRRMKVETESAQNRVDYTVEIYHIYLATSCSLVFFKSNDEKLVIFAMKTWNSPGSLGRCLTHQNWNIAPYTIMVVSIPPQNRGIKSNGLMEAAKPWFAFPRQTMNLILLSWWSPTCVYRSTLWNCHLVVGEDVPKLGWNMLNNFNFWHFAEHSSCWQDDSHCHDFGRFW